MNKKDLKVGMKVKTIRGFGPVRAGTIGTVKTITTGDPPIGIEFNNLVYGHSLNDLLPTKSLKGYFLYAKDIKQYNDEMQKLKEDMLG